MFHWDLLGRNVCKVGMSIATASEEHVSRGDFDKIAQCLTNDIDNRIVTEEMLTEWSGESYWFVS